MWQLNGFFLFYIITLQSSHVTNAASDLYVQRGRNVTIPCLLNITKSNIGSLYWQKINNSTQGFETVYSFIKYANGPGWRSPLLGYIVNFTDLVLLNVTFSHDGVYNCKILTHSAPRIFDRKTYLHVILPLLDIEVRRSKAGTVINDGEVIQLLLGEETDVECAVVGNVSPPAQLGWVTSDNHNQTYVSTAMHHGPSSSVRLNGSRVIHEENVTCRAVQWIAGRPYLTVESTFILKRLNSPSIRSRNINGHRLIIAPTLPSLLTLLVIIVIIVFIFRRKKKGYYYSAHVYRVAGNTEGDDQNDNDRDENKRMVNPFEPEYINVIPDREAGKNESDDQNIGSRDENRPMDNQVDQDINDFSDDFSDDMYNDPGDVQDGEVFYDIPIAGLPAVQNPVQPDAFFRHGKRGAEGVSTELLDEYSRSIVPGNVQKRTDELKWFHPRMSDQQLFLRYQQT